MTTCIVVSQSGSRTAAAIKLTTNFMEELKTKELSGEPSTASARIMDRYLIVGLGPLKPQESLSKVGLLPIILAFHALVLKFC